MVRGNNLLRHSQPQGSLNKMTEKTNTTIEEKIRRDGSLSEERKVALLKLVSTMKPEMKISHKSQSNTKGTIRPGDHSTDSITHKTKKHKY
jgi:hypothetical protein